MGKRIRTRPENRTSLRLTKMPVDLAVVSMIMLTPEVVVMTTMPVIIIVVAAMGILLVMVVVDHIVVTAGMVMAVVVMVMVRNAKIIIGDRTLCALLHR